MNLIDKSIPTPYYVVDENLLIKNLEILQAVAKSADCKILLAQKAFSMFKVYPLIAKYLDGTTASGLHEAKLGFEEMGKYGKQTHIFSAGYRDEEMDEIFEICDHIIFNSMSQWKRYQSKAIMSGKSCGLRINPEFSTQIGHDIYDPCSATSRLGITLENFDESLLAGISGLHFHTLCEQNCDDLVATLHAFEEKFGKYIAQMQWINFGGGHHITRSDYDRNLLIKTIKDFKQKYSVQIYLEPGEAIALNAGFLVCTVLDIFKNHVQIAILDTSAACHMPDVIEMPYRPRLLSSGNPSEKEYTYKLGGMTCLAGDNIGLYSFDQPLQVGDNLVFCDMAIYSMVKNNTFNGINLPSIVLKKQNGEFELVKKFGYQDFKRRLS